jgi:Zn-dependent protease with chaperone function
MAVHGWFYDGKSTLRKEAQLFDDSDQIRVHLLDGQEFVFSKSEALVSDRLGSIPRGVTFQDGSHFETLDNDSIDKIFPKKTVTRTLESFERSRSVVLVSLLSVLLFMFIGYFFVLPKAAQDLAPLVPKKLSSLITSQAVMTFEKLGLMEPSELTGDKSEMLNELFSDLKTSHPDLGLELLTRKSKIGPNAFALPDGTVLVTDALVELAEDREQLLAVLLHESGHVFHRHSLRMLIESSAISLFIFTMVGGLDLTQIPLAILANAYSRAYELEADQFAGQELLKRNLSPVKLAEMLELITKRVGQKSEDQEKGGTDFLSTHPSTSERIIRLRSSNPLLVE